MTDELEPADRDLVERIASWLAPRKLAAPAILFLESSRPLSFVGSQAMVGAAPVVHAIEPLLRLLGPEFTAADFDRLAGLFERRDGLELLIIEIERRAQAQRAAEKEEKRRRKEARRAAKALRKAPPRKRREDHA